MTRAAPLLLAAGIFFIAFPPLAEAQFSGPAIVRQPTTINHCPKFLGAGLNVLVDSGTACGGGGSTSPGGLSGQLQWNNASAFGGVAGVTSNGTSLTVASGDLKLSGSSSGTATLNAPATGGATLTLPPGADTVAGIAATQTLTNKTIDGGSNTLSNVSNAALTNDSITIGSTNVALGATISTINGNLTFGGSNAYGTPASINLSNGSNYPLASLTGAGTGVLAALAIAHDTTGGVCTVGGSGCVGTGNALFGTASGNTSGDVVTMSNTMVGVQDSGTPLTSLANVSTVHQISTGTLVTAAEFLHGDGFVASAALALTYPATSTLSAANGSNFVNAQGGIVTITPNGSDVVCVDGSCGSGGATYALAQGNSGWVTSNGSGQLQLALSLGASSGAVSGVSNSDGTLTISPTTGAVVASLALGHANTWSGAQTYGAGDLILSGATSGDVGTFSSGHALQDSGTLLSSLAALASPTFTGTVTTNNLTVNGTCTGCGAGGPAAIGYTSGPYYTANWASSYTAQLTVSSRLYFLPFYNVAVKTFTKISIDVTTLQTGGECELGVYANSAGAPTGAYLVDAGQTAATSNGQSEITGQTIALSANTWYWLAVSCTASSTLPSIEATNAALGSPLGLATAGAPYVGYYMTWAYSTGNLPTVSGLTENSASGGPLVYLRY